VYIHVFVNMYIYTYIYVSVWRRGEGCVYRCVCGRVLSVHTCICTYVCIEINMCVSGWRRSEKYICINMYVGRFSVYTHIYVHRYI